MAPGESMIAKVLAEALVSLALKVADGVVYRKVDYHRESRSAAEAALRSKFPPVSGVYRKPLP